MPSISKKIHLRHKELSYVKSPQNLPLALRKERLGKLTCSGNIKGESNRRMEGFVNNLRALNMNQ